MKKGNPGKTYVGIVEDINDPDKQGRVKARVLDVYDDLKLEDIPWANPWKDLSGGQFGLPEVGKVVIVVFEQGNTYKPEYISTEHWNVNLENKLKSLSDSDYVSMKTVLFDHKNQIYSNDSEGLKIDHKFNNINIKDNGINLNLKDNNMMLNIGDSTANQQMLLGNNWINWFDTFVDALSQNLAFIGNSGAPVLVSPSLAKVLAQYQSLKDSKFLSHHINAVDNNKVSTVKNEERQEVAQSGDTWQSTKTENTLTTVTEETNEPVDGEKPKYDEKFSEPPTDKVGVPISDPIPEKPVIPSPQKSEISSNKDVEKLIWFLKTKKYTIFEEKHQLNMIAMRSVNKIEGDVTNKFDEILHVFYRNSNNNWELVEYDITTVPGFKPGTEELPDEVPMLRLGQYIEQLKLDNFGGDEKHKCLIFEKCAIHKNTELDFYDWDSDTQMGNFPISIHRSSETSTAEFVFNYSEGSQVFKNINQYDQFIKLCEDQINIAKKDKFTYTLCSKKEFDEYPSPDEQKKVIGNLSSPIIGGLPTPSTDGLTIPGTDKPVSGNKDVISKTTTGSSEKTSDKSKPDYTEDVKKLMKSGFVSEPGKKRIDVYLSEFKQNGKGFDTSKIISFGEGLSKDDLDAISDKLQTKDIKIMTKNQIIPKLRKELIKHIIYLSKNEKVDVDDYFKIEDGKVKSENGLIIFRMTRRSEDEEAYKSITKDYTNLLGPDGKIHPDKPSNKKSWVIEDKEKGIIFAELKFMPFLK